MAGLNRDTESQHWPDTFKQHGHPTFSVESQYSKGPNDGGRWNGDVYVPGVAVALPARKPSSASPRASQSEIAVEKPAPSVEQPSLYDQYKASTEKPTILDSVGEGIKEFGSAIRHPIDTAVGMAGGIAKSGFDALFTPVVGSEASGIGGRGGRASLPQGTVVTAENTPGAVSGSDALHGTVSSAVNIGFLLAPELALPARVAVNAGLGAAYDSENRVRGATAGALFGEAFHQVTNLGGKLLRGKPAVETTVSTAPLLGDQSGVTPTSDQLIRTGEPAPTYADFVKGVDQVTGDVAPKTAGGNRKPVPGAVNAKYRLDDDQALLNRAAELLKRQEEYSSGAHGAPGFARDAVDLSKPITGDTGVARRMAQDKSLYEEVTTELKGRGWPESDLADAIDSRYRGEPQAVDEPPDQRQSPRPDGTYVWTPEERSRYITDKQKAFAAGVNKPWGQWSADEKQSYFAEQEGIKAGFKNGDIQPDNPVLISAPAKAQIIDNVAKPITSRPFVDALRRIFAPANRGAQATNMGDVVRSNRGEMDRTNAIAATALEDFSKTFQKMPETDRLAFTDNMENGRPQTTPQLTLASQKIRGLYDNAVQAVQDLGTGKLENPLPNYMAHLWENPENAGNVLTRLMSKRPMEGSKAFLKQRLIPTTMEGIEAGLRPVTTNPVELTLMKLHEMNKYVMAQRILADGKEKGLLKFVRATDRAPDGHVKINDPIATVSGPLTEEGARTIRGSYYAPEPVARVLNNYLSPGLRGEPIFKAYMAIGNAVNQATLGLSAYHAGFTSMETIVSKNALGVEQLASGKPLQALKSFATSLAAPVTNYRLGGKALAEYNRPGSIGGRMSEIVAALSKGGGRVSMSDLYKNNSIDRLLKAVAERRVVGAVSNAIPAALEFAAKPIMEYLVPRQKLGIFADLMSHKLDELGPNVSPDQLTREAGLIWDSVDNRMGQVVYDNYFWNKAFQDLSMASVRSVGWNAGTVRELGGGVMDAVKAPGRIRRGEAVMTHKLAYAISLPITVGMMGAITHFLYTGTAPETLDDYYHPKTGRKNDQGEDERVNLPSYMKDVFAYKRHPWQTVQNKLHPMIGIVGDMLNNKDYFGDEIRNPDDPIVVQMQQEARFIAKAVAPYGVQNLLEQRARGQSLATQAASFIGITPASREDVRSPAENLMSQYIAQSTPGSGTPEEQDARGVRREVRDLVRAGQTASPTVINAVKSGLLSRTSVNEAAKNALLPPSLVSFKRLTYDQAVKVYNAGTPDEQRLWYAALVKKYHSYAVTH